MTIVNDVIACADTRPMLLDKLMQLEGDFMTKVRFIAAVNELASPNDNKAHSICMLFAHDKSMFKIHTLSADTLQAMQQLQPSILQQARIEIICELSRNQQFMQIADLLIL